MRLKGDGAQFQSHFPLPERKRERDDKNKKQNCGGGREIDGRGDNQWKEVNIKRFILCGHQKD